MTIETPRLLLRELTLDDAPALHAVECHDIVTRYLPFDSRSPEEVMVQIERAIKNQNESPRHFFDFAVVPHGSTSLIGRSGFGMFRPEHHEAGIWYDLGPEYWGKGYATEAMTALLPFAFNELKLHRLFADIDPRNEASCRVAKKLGFKLEGVFRENYWLKGEWCDAAIYAILDREWRALSANKKRG